MQSYQQAYLQASQEPEAFWAAQAAKLNWHTPPTVILAQDPKGNHQWFRDGRLNTSWLALDAHVEAGRGDQAAIIYDSPVTSSKEIISYADLTRRVAQCAGMLGDLGVAHGDRVIIYMPMIPEAAIAMLACARIGAVHCVVFGGFAAPELAVRIDDAQADIILTASCGIEVDRTIAYKPLVDAAMAQARHPIRHCVVFQRPQCLAELFADRDLDWQQAIANAQPVEAVAVCATDDDLDCLEELKAQLACPQEGRSID